MFNRTRSMSNAVCFKHDNNDVCACAVSALILLQIVNLLREMDLATSVSYTTWTFWQSDAAFVYFDDFSLHMRSLTILQLSRLKSNVIFEFSAAIFL